MLVCLDHSEKGGRPVISCQTNYCPTVSPHNNKIIGCHWDCHLFRFLCEFGREDVAVGWGLSGQGLCMLTVCMSHDEWVILHCREAPLPMACQPPENCGMACLVMTLPWVHDSQPQPGYIRSPWSNGPGDTLKWQHSTFFWGWFSFYIFFKVLTYYFCFFIKVVVGAKAPFLLLIDFATSCLKVKRVKYATLDSRTVLLPLPHCARLLVWIFMYSCPKLTPLIEPHVGMLKPQCLYLKMSLMGEENVF